MIAPALALALFLLQAGPYAGAPVVVLPQTAKQLLRVALPKRERLLPGLSFEQYEGSSNRFYFFTVAWAAAATSSVVAGNYAVDRYTGDVWSATRGCDELSTASLRKMQAKVRSDLGLSSKQYQGTKTHGPLCDQ